MTDIQLPMIPTAQIDPRTQVTQIPGVDARCEAGHTADTCRWPFCRCEFPDRTTEGGNE